MKPNQQFIQVQTTTGSRDLALSITQHLIDRHLASCVHVMGPITSVYRWNGAVESSEEWLCLIKTSEDKFADVEREIRLLHTYEVPEIIAVPIINGSEGYLAWLSEALHG